jgi:YceI-like domain
MKHFTTRIFNCFLFFMLLLQMQMVQAQEKLKATNVNIIVSGTSTLHDWDMKSDKGSCDGIFVLDGTNVTALNDLNFSIPSKSLKSEHTLMDNNTYKALKADVYPDISFKFVSATITAKDATTCQIKCIGKLTIAGTMHETDITATGKVNADKSITITGSKAFKMTDYKVKPPSVMMGTIKTGNDITITYNFKLVK